MIVPLRNTFLFSMNLIDLMVYRKYYWLFLTLGEILELDGPDFAIVELGITN